MWLSCMKNTHKKSREPVPVTRPTLWGLRIALPVGTSNAEAHADMLNNTCGDMRRKFVYNIPRKHLPLLRFSDRNKKVAKFQSVKNETSSKRLSLYVVFPPRAQKPPAWEFLQIYGNLCEMQKEVCDFVTFFVFAGAVPIRLWLLF